jgi:hypothetical protein
MSKLYNEKKIIKLDPLGSRLDDVGLTGGVGRLNKLKLRKTKKIIQKTPNKKFKSETTSGKTQKKLALRQQKNIADKMTQKGDPYTPPIKAFKRGGDVMPARNKKNFRSTKSGAGMTRAGVKAYRRANPGSKLKTAVTGKVKPGSKAANRRKSYCARSAGQMKKFPKAAADPNSRLRQARRRWKC